MFVLLDTKTGGVYAVRDDESVDRVVQMFVDKDDAVRYYEMLKDLNYTRELEVKEIEETQVKDSRPSEDNSSIRRRRQCPACGARFTTFERVQLRELMVIKKDNTRTVFDREKLVRSINISCRKRSVNADKIELITNSIRRRLESSGETEIPTKVIGELVMDALKELDRVAYLRFASVYKDFQETDDFRKFIDKNLNLKNE